MAAGMQHIFRRPLIHNRDYLAATEYSTLLNTVHHNAALRASSPNLLPSLRRLFLICRAPCGVSVVRKFSVGCFSEQGAIPVTEME